MTDVRSIAARDQAAVLPNGPVEKHPLATSFKSSAEAAGIKRDFMAAMLVAEMWYTRCSLQIPAAAPVTSLSIGHHFIEERELKAARRLLKAERRRGTNQPKVTRRLIERNAPITS
ncbi:hypothetical protein V5799_017425 [Amblyomma americanum]|uniref:Uncharacterized protein n=1 Tax=Amblyomma americanum TaxID=6943 RepID=A0AAQ4F265_AMBAM